MSEACIFCRIVAREIPGDVVYEDDRVLAFRDLNPQAPTHVLINPNVHVASVADIQEAHVDDLAYLLPAAAKIARDQGTADSGFRLTINTGAGAGQSVFHLHMHLLGGREFSWPPG